MSLLGKILAALNVLAAIAFFYLATVDYAKRQHWAYALYRHDLKINGLPLTDKEEDREGHVLANNLDATTLQDVFASAGGAPVKSQMEEVQRVRQDLQRKLSDPNPIIVANPLDANQKLELKSQLQKLAWALRPLVELPTRRQPGQIQPHEAMARRHEELTRLMTLPDNQPLVLNGLFTVDVEQELMKRPAADQRQALTERLTADLNQAFDELNRPRDREGQRQTIAQLLLSLAELSVDEKTEPGKDRSLLNDPSYRRAVTVVGLGSAERELNGQAKDLVGMAQAVNTSMAHDKTLFLQQHGALVARLLVKADLVNDLLAEVARTGLKVEAQQAVLANRQKEVKQQEAKLTEREKATGAVLEQQSQLEKQLFGAQQKFRDVAKQNRELEEKLRTQEKGR